MLGGSTVQMVNQKVYELLSDMKERLVSLTVNVGVFTSRLVTRFKESSVDTSVSGIGNEKPLERQAVLPLE